MSSPKTRAITVRLSEPAARRLRERARSQGVTPSELVRELLARELGGDDGGLVERTAQFIGAIREPRVSAGRDARRDLDAWRPDRRG